VVVYTHNPVLERLRQKNCEFKDSLGCIVRPCLKKKKKENQRERNTIKHSG
jgi:hypothetical protein